VLTDPKTPHAVEMVAVGARDLHRIVEGAHERVRGRIVGGGPRARSWWRH
jgi:hypothetical protein